MNMSYSFRLEKSAPGEAFVKYDDYFTIEQAKLAGNNILGVKKTGWRVRVIDLATGLVVWSRDYDTDAPSGDDFKTEGQCDKGFHWDATTQTCIADAPIVESSDEFDWAANWFWVVGIIIIIILIIMYWYFKVYDGGV
jgi:hypothetical protein